MSKADGRKVAKILKANGSLTDSGLDAIWDLANYYNKKINICQNNHKHYK